MDCFTAGHHGVTAFQVLPFSAIHTEHLKLSWWTARPFATLATQIQKPHRVQIAEMAAGRSHVRRPPVVKRTHCPRSGTQWAKGPPGLDHQVEVDEAALNYRSDAIQPRFRTSCCGWHVEMCVPAKQSGLVVLAHPVHCRVRDFKGLRILPFLPYCRGNRSRCSLFHDFRISSTLICR